MIMFLLVKWRWMLTIAAVVVAVVPAPARAHTVGGDGGFELEFLLLGAVVTISALIYRAVRDAKPLLMRAWIGLGIALVAVSFVIPRVGGEASASDAAVQIVAPKAGATLPAGKRVLIEARVKNAEVARNPASSEGGHLHVFVDGELQEMVYATATEVKLEPGRHTISVEYTDARHVSFDPRILDSIQVTAE